jgi:hypothetical protein
MDVRLARRAQLGDCPVVPRHENRGAGLGFGNR